MRKWQAEVNGQETEMNGKWFMKKKRGMQPLFFYD